MKSLSIIIAGVVSLALPICVIAQTVADHNLRVQTWISGASNPTGFAFIDDSGSGLMLEKNTGKVALFENRQRVKNVLDLAVSNDSERGLLGMALSPDFATDRFVYLYYTAASVDGGAPISNSVKRFRYDPTSKTLSFVKKVIDLPATPGPSHDGGKISFGPDGKLYIVSGELNRNELTSNYKDSPDLNRIGSVLRINSSGSSVSTNPFYNAAKKKSPANDIYAYGIRNSFGMAFDPVSKNLWMSENGPQNYDEINRITPGFNSGWERIMGPVAANPKFDPNTLVSLGDGAHFEDPEFSWKFAVAPTAMYFQPSVRLGAQYKNDLFVGSVRGGKLLHFDLSASRKDLALSGELADKIADNSADARFAGQDAILFGDNFGTVTDLIAGPGGMYVLSYSNGKLYRITNNDAATISSSMIGTVVPEPAGFFVIFSVMTFLTRRNAPFRSNHITNHA